MVSFLVITDDLASYCEKVWVIDYDWEETYHGKSSLSYIFSESKIVNMLYGWFNLLFIIGHSHIFQNFQRYVY